MKKIINFFLLPFLPFKWIYDLIWYWFHPCYWDTIYTYSSELDRFCRKMLRTDKLFLSKENHYGLNLKTESYVWGGLEIKSRKDHYGNVREYFVDKSRPSLKTIHKMKYREINDNIKQKLNA